jgi:hypothetical protein
VSKFDSFVKAATGKTATKKQERGGRSTGRAKRDNPDYKQALAYVRRDTHKQVMATLAAQEREFSDLVEELLTKWLSVNS